MERKGGKVERERKLKTKENEKETKKNKTRLRSAFPSRESPIVHIYTHTHMVDPIISSPFGT